MGGRGGSGTGGGRGGGRSKDGKAIRNVGGASDKRSDIQTMFQEIGFSDVRGTNNISTQLLGAYAIRMNQLERQYGAISASDNPEFLAGSGRDAAVAEVQYYPWAPTQQSMVINTSYMGNLQSNLATERAMEERGWFTQTNGSITNATNYAITHEYGHMLENALASQAGVNSSSSLQSYENSVRSEVINIAQTRYGASSSDRVSNYGATNSAEFFAESFASLNSGSPSAYGRALGDWLESNKLR